MAVVGVRAFALARAAFRYLERLLSHDAAFSQLSELRMGVFARILPIAPAGLKDTGRGDLLTLLVRDVDDLQDLPLRVVQPLATAAIVALVSVVGVWLILPAAGVTLAVCLVAGAVVGSCASGALAARSERMLAPLRGQLADRILEVVENLDVLSAFGVLDSRLAAVRDIDERLRRATLRRSFGAGVQFAVTSLCAGAATVLALIAGTPALGAGDHPAANGLSGPALAVIVLVPMAVFEVFGAIPASLGAWRQVRSSARRVAGAVPAVVPAEIPVELPSVERPSSVEAIRTPPLLELSDLSVTWPGAATPAVSGVTLRLAPGDRLHLAGPSGAGKTTLAQGLVRFLDYGGSYRLGGVEARSLSQGAVRRTVGLCEQRPWLFDDSIRQNLLFARESATDADLLAVLARVGLGSWVAERGGLDARVGERGALVSGGQAQRIALARALLADFPVLIVDEPAANVDAAQGESLVRDILAAAGPNRAVLLISHIPVPPELITSRLTL
jgi:ATP-binding cassette subfamily C protein CydC